MSEHICPKCNEAWNCAQLDCPYPDSICEACTYSFMMPEEIFLSERDWKTFTDAIENPPEPNEKLKEAMKDYKNKYGDK